MSRKPKGRPAPPRPRRWRPASIVIGIFCVGVGIFLATRGGNNSGGPPALPSVNTNGLDISVATAIEKCRADIQAAPDSAESWGRLGMVLSIHDFIAEADTCFAEAERLDPRDPRWPYIRGLARSGDDPRAALPGLRRAAELSAGQPPAPTLRYAEGLIEAGQLDDAEKQIRPVLDRDPRDARAWLGLGRIYSARGQFAESRDALQKSLQENPKVKAAHALLAGAHQRLGDSAAADAELKLAATLPENPEWPDPFLREVNSYRTGKIAATDRAAAWLAQGRAREAFDQLRPVVRVYPDFGKGWLLLGRAAVALTNHDEAERALRKAIALEPESVEARVELGNAFFARNQWAEAEASFREAIRLRPAQAEAWFDLGLCRLNQRDPEGAVRAFETATRYKPDLALGYIRWGQALGRLGQLPEAIAQLQHGLELAPDNAEAKEMLEILRRVGPEPK